MKSRQLRVQVTLSRTVSNWDDPRPWMLTLTDKETCSLIARLTLGNDEFANLLSSRTAYAEGDVFQSDKWGRSMESSSIYTPHTYGETDADVRARFEVPEGWELEHVTRNNRGQWVGVIRRYGDIVNIASLGAPSESSLVNEVAPLSGNQNEEPK